VSVQGNVDPWLSAELLVFVPRQDLYKNNMQLKPAIVVTGASSGIGREIARVAVRDGAFLLLVARSAESLAALVQELESQGGVAAALPLDLQRPDVPDRIEQALRERNLYCDVLVNSAGFGVFGQAAVAQSAEQLNLLDVNIRALTALTLRFLPGMIERRRGGVLNVGSITGYFPGPNMAAYYASKAFIRSFSAALAAEVAGSGVTVTCLAPGVVRTPFFERCGVGESRLMKLMPRSDAVATAQAGWQGFKAGKSLVVPRLINRMIVGIFRLVPDRWMARLVMRLQRVRHT
jgi:short-subunit dehydrogenase